MLPLSEKWRVILYRHFTLFERVFHTVPGTSQPFFERPAHIIRVMVKPYPYNKSAYYAKKYGYPTVGAGKVKGAATKIQRAFRKRRQIMFLKKYVPKAMATSKYGRRITVPQPKQRSKAKQPAPPFATNYVNMGTLNQQVVPFPRTISFANRINAKEDASLFIKGIRFVRTFEFLRHKPGGEDPVPECPPIIMHWAVIQLREANVGVDNWTDEIKKSFFRTFDDDFDRVEDFVDNSDVSPWLSSQNWNKMNPDGTFNILTHRKRLLVQKFGIQGLDHKVQPYLWHIDTYMKINKSFTYTNTDQAYPDNPLFEVYWYQTVTPTDYPIGYSNFFFVGTVRQPTVFFD